MGLGVATAVAADEASTVASASAAAGTAATLTIAMADVVGGERKLCVVGQVGAHADHVQAEALLCHPSAGIQKAPAHAIAGARKRIEHGGELSPWDGAEVGGRGVDRPPAAVERDQLWDVLEEEGTRLADGQHPDQLEVEQASPAEVVEALALAALTEGLAREARRQEVERRHLMSVVVEYVAAEPLRPKVGRIRLLGGAVDLGRVHAASAETLQAQAEAPDAGKELCEREAATSGRGRIKRPRRALLREGAVASHAWKEVQQPRRRQLREPRTPRVGMKGRRGWCNRRRRRGVSRGSFGRRARQVAMRCQHGWQHRSCGG